MSTNPKQLTIEYLAKTRGKRLCTILEIDLKEHEGSERVTDHDRIVRVEGKTYTPIGFSNITFDRREGGLRGGTSQGYGIIDGLNITIDDVAGAKYRGATVKMAIVDWKYPWVIPVRQEFVISTIKWTPTSWVATLENLSMRLQKPQGGRFRGAFTARCGYVLGGKYCRKNLVGLENKSVTIAAITKSRQSFTTVPARWENTQGDGYFKEGEFQFLFGVPDLESQATSVVSGSNLRDTTQTWTVDEHKGKYLRILNGTGSYAVEYHKILSNSSDTITIRGTFESSHAIGKFYDICPVSEFASLVCPVANYNATSGLIELFFPTRKELPIGHSGVLRPGCDGLFSTCKTKFANQLNFGGLDSFTPTPAEIIRPPEDD